MIPSNEVFIYVFTAFLICTALFLMPVRDHLGEFLYKNAEHANRWLERWGF